MSAASTRTRAPRAVRAGDADRYAKKEDCDEKGR